MEYTADTLADQFSWLRPLVVSVLSDESEADDVLQDLVLAAMRLGRPVRRSWMAKVARGLSIDVVRKRQSRARREQAAARGEAVEAAADVVERAATCQRLIDTVMGLDEPLATTVLKRFWDNKPPRIIAQEMGVSADTVRLRLKKAQDVIRVRMDRAHGGDRRAWAAPLLLHLATPGSLLAPAAGTAAQGGFAGGLAFGSRWAVGALAVAAIAVGGWAVTAMVSEPDLSSSGDRGPAVSRSASARAVPTLGAVATSRSIDGVGTNGPPSREDVTAQDVEVVGRCVHAEDESPLGGVEVAVYAGAADEPVARTTSAADGSFVARFARGDSGSAVRVGFGGEPMEHVVEWEWPRHVRTLDIGPVALTNETSGLALLPPELARQAHWLSMGSESTDGEDRGEARRAHARVRSTLVAAERLTVHVVDGRSGVALESFGIQLTPRGLGCPSPPPWDAIALELHPAGSAEILTGTGPQTLSVRPPLDSGLAPRRIAVDDLPGGRELTVVVRPMLRRFEARRGGRPLPGVDVQLVERVETRGGARPRIGFRAVGALPTDVAGAATALVPEDRALLAGVRSADWVAPLVEVWRGLDGEPDPSPVTLQAVPAAALRGVVGGIDETAAPVRDLEVYLAPPGAGGDAVTWLLPEPAKVGATGDFLLECCPPGSWEARLRFTLPVPGTARRQAYSVALGAVAGMQPADRRELPVSSVSAWAPGHVRVTVVDEARRPIAGAVVGIMADDAATAVGFDAFGGLAADTDAEGRVEPFWLPPGSYRLLHPATGAQADVPIVVTPGQVVDHTVRLRSRALELSFVDVEGRPLGDVDVGWSGTDLSEDALTDLAPIGTTDPSGRLRLGMVPSQPTSVYVRRNGSWQRVGLLGADQLASEQATLALRFAVPRR